MAVQKQVSIRANAPEFSKYFQAYIQRGQVSLILQNEPRPVKVVDMCRDAAGVFVNFTVEEVIYGSL